MVIGYARTSTQDQNQDLQIDALKKAGCEKMYSDKVSGTVSERPGLTKLKEQLRKGDILVVYRLDRLARSIKDLIDWVTYLEKEGVAFKSVHENIDTTTPTGKLTFHIFAAIAEFERSLIIERTQAGLAAARARGRKGGRPKALNKDKRDVAVDLYNQKKLTIEKICEMMEITKPTLYNYIRGSSAQPS